MDDRPCGGEEGDASEDTQEEENGGCAHGDSNKVRQAMVRALRKTRRRGGLLSSLLGLSEWQGSEVGHILRQCLEVSSVLRR